MHIEWFSTAASVDDYDWWLVTDWSLGVVNTRQKTVTYQQIIQNMK